MACLVSISKLNTPSVGISNDQPSVNHSSTDIPSNGYSMVHLSHEVHSNEPEKKSDPKEVITMNDFRSERKPVNVEWKNITTMTKNGKVILKQLSGSVCSGELIAIMGPSGAGKSTLLNVLCGFTRQKVIGDIFVNGTIRDMSVFSKLYCYILQEDYLLPRLTVKETVTFAANLKIPTSVPKEERKKAVEDCLRSLGLDSQANQRANSLSGGQRKRLCIAQELVSNPPLIFLDEPTSGLDSSSCLQCIQLLKSQAEDGRTVVCTIHQPSSKILEIFDKLYMVANGQCIYKGPVRNLIPFLAEQGLNCPQYYNPADYIMEVAIGEYGDWNAKLKKETDALDDTNQNSLSQMHLQSAESGQNLSVQVSTISLISRKMVSQENLQHGAHGGFATGYFNQFRVLLCRYFLCVFREPMTTQLKLGANVSVGLFLGTLYYGFGNDADKVFNNTGLIFCFLMFLTFIAMFPTLLTFPMQRAIFKREHMNSWYSAGTYYLAATVAEIPLQIVYPIITCSIVYWMTDQPNDMVRFGLFVLSAILVSLVAQAMGHVIGAGSEVQNGVYIASMTFFPILLFCGFLITIKNMPSYLRWLQYITFARYTLRSVMFALYSMDRPFLYCNKTYCPFEDPKEILKELDVEADIYVDYSALLGFFIFFRILAYFVLRFKVIRVKW